MVPVWTAPEAAFNFNAHRDCPECLQVVRDCPILAHPQDHETSKAVTAANKSLPEEKGRTKQGETMVKSALLTIN